MMWTRFLVPFKSSLGSDDSYINGQLVCPDMIKNGTTSFADSGGIHMERMTGAILESVMQTTTIKFTIDVGGTTIGAMKETAEEAIVHTRGLYKAYDGKGDGRVST